MWTAVLNSNPFFKSEIYQNYLKNICRYFPNLENLLIKWEDYTGLQYLLQMLFYIISTASQYTNILYSQKFIYSLNEPVWHKLSKHRTTHFQNLNFGLQATKVCACCTLVQLSQTYFNPWFLLPKSQINQMEEKGKKSSSLHNYTSDFPSSSCLFKVPWKEHFLHLSLAIS